MGGADVGNPAWGANTVKIRAVAGMGGAERATIKAHPTTHHPPSPLRNGAGDDAYLSGIGPQGPIHFN